MTNKDKINILAEIAEYDGESSLREDYSGRCMCGDTCIGIVTPYPTEIMEEAATAGITGARTDSMGLKTIVYWPSVKGDQELI